MPFITNDPVVKRATPGPFITNDPVVKPANSGSLNPAPFITNDPALSPEDAETQQAVAARKIAAKSRLDPMKYVQGAGAAISDFTDQVEGSAGELGSRIARPEVPQSVDEAIIKSSLAHFGPLGWAIGSDLPKVAFESGLRGSSDLAQQGKDVFESQVLDPLRIVRKAVKDDGLLTTAVKLGTLPALSSVSDDGRVVVPPGMAASPFVDKPALMLKAFPKQAAEVIRDAQARDEQQSKERDALQKGDRSLLGEVATAVASMFTDDTILAEEIGKAVAPPKNLAQTTDLSSNFADPGLLQSRAVRLGTRVGQKLAPELTKKLSTPLLENAGKAEKIAEAQKARERLAQIPENNRKAWEEAVRQGVETTPPLQSTPTRIVPPSEAELAKALFADKAAQAAQQAPGVVQKGVGKVGQAAETGGKLVETAARKVDELADKYEGPLSVASAIAGAAKGPIGAIAGSQVPGALRKAAKWSQNASQAGTALRTIANTDWNSSIPVWRQIAKDPNAPKWLVRGVTANVVGKLKAGDLVEKGLRTGTDLGKGIVEGAGTDTLITALDTSKSGEEIGGEAGVGGLLGGAGTVPALKAMSNERKALSFAYDSMKKASESIKNGADPLVVASTPDDLMHSSVILEQTFRGMMSGRQDLKVDLMDAAQFAKASKDPNAAAYFDESTGRVAVNLESADAAGRQLHEIGHALMASVAASNPAIVQHFQQALGPDGMARARQDYQQALGRTIPQDDAFIVGELFSEAMANGLRGVNLNEALPVVLGRTATQSFFRDADVRKVLKDPATIDLVRQQFQAASDFRPALDMEKEPGVKLRPEQAGNHPALPTETRADGSQGNDFVDVVNGQTRETPVPVVRARVRNRRKEVLTLFPDVPPSGNANPQASNIGVRQGPSGMTEKTGTRLGEQFYATARSFGEGTKNMLRRVEQAIANNETMAGWYQQIGTGDGWAASVRESLGAMEAQYKDFIPFAFKVDKQGNLLIQNYSITALDRKASDWAGRSGPLSLEMWNGDLNTFKADVQTYLKNHAEGRPGSDGIGEMKRNLINVFLVGGNRTFEALNPLRAQAKGKDRQGIVRSYRADRLQTVEPSDVTGYEKPDYSKQVRNLSPNLRNSPQVGEDGFYSKLEQVIDTEMKGASMPAAQLMAVLRNRGVKQEEMKWTNAEALIRNLAEQNGGKVPKEQLLKALQQANAGMLDQTGGPQWEVGNYSSSRRFPTEAEAQAEADSIADFWTGEVARGWSVEERDGKFIVTNEAGDPVRTQYSDDGRIVWRPEEYATEQEAEEALREGAQAVGRSQARVEQITTETQYEDYQLPGGQNYREIVFTAPKAEPFTSSHFSENASYLGHMRVNERLDMTGKPGLFIEEIQSDRHQKARTEGYAQTKEQMQARMDELLAVPAKDRTSAQNDEITTLSSNINSQTGGQTGVPDAPFRKDWPVQIFKRALRDAVRDGKAWIGWTAGDTQADRFDLSKRFSEVHYSGNTLYARDHNGKTVIYEQGVKPEQLPELIGAETAAKLLAAPVKGRIPSQSLTGLDLKVGGEGMKAFYDKILPNEVQKYVKQYGAKVEKGELDVAPPNAAGRLRYEIVDPRGEVFDAYETYEQAASAAQDAGPGYRVKNLQGGEKTPFWKVQITPEMAQSIKTRGQERFSPQVVSSAQLELDFNKAVDQLGTEEALAPEKPAPAPRAPRQPKDAPTTFSITASRIKRLLKRGPVNPIGMSAATAQDRHAVAALFRNPAFEAMRWVFLKEGKVVAVANTTVRRPEMVYVMTKGIDVQQMANLAVESGADSVFWTHNHPSGNSSPSDPDIRITRSFWTQSSVQSSPLSKLQFLGHIVTNHTDHHLIGPDGLADLVKIEATPTDKLLNKPLWDAPVNSPAALARAGAALSNGNNPSRLVMFLDPRLNVKAVGEISPNIDSLKFAEEVRKYAKAAGAVSAVAYGFFGSDAPMMERLVKDGILMDAHIVGIGGVRNAMMSPPPLLPSPPVALAEDQIVRNAGEKLLFSPEVATDVQDAALSEHDMAVQRQERATINTKSIKHSEAEQKIVLDAAKAALGEGGNAPKLARDILRRMSETKANYPVSQGWMPMEVRKVTFKKDAAGKLVTDKSGNLIPEIEYATEQYTFNKDPNTGRDSKETHAARIRTISRRTVQAVTEVVERARSGDRAAQVMLRQLGWYKNMADRLTRETGGFADLFADLLGAFSPNTDVPSNWKYAVEALRKVSAGDYDAILKEFTTYLDNGGTPEQWRTEKRPMILRDNQKLFGMNSINGMKAMADLWRLIEAGQAPKARNFALNLVRQSLAATIDVWAARFLQRMSGGKRIPVPAEAGVAGTTIANPSTYVKAQGAFGFGQEAMADAAAKLREKFPDIMGDMEPPDLQALVWFLEKEYWAKNDWTTKSGEGGSFEAEADKTRMGRYIAGVSQERPEFKPTGGEQDSIATPLSRKLAKLPNVLAARVMDTVGYFMGGKERSFDLEVVADKDFDPTILADEVIQIGREKNQDAVFVSRILNRDEQSDNARPGFEVYFNDRRSFDASMPAIQKLLDAGLDGLTMVVDPRTSTKDYPDTFIGVRFQYIPEFAGDANWKENAAQIAEKIGALRDKMEYIEGVSRTVQVDYDTLVWQRSDYDNDPTTGTRRGEGRKGAWTQRALDAAAKGRTGRGQGKSVSKADLPDGGSEAP